MTQHTNLDSARKAMELTKPIEEEKEKKRKHLLNNAAAYTTIMVIVLSAALYSFNSGYSSVYNIPVSAMPVNLKSYIPVTVQFIGVTTWILYYISTIQQEKALKRRKYNLMRVMYGFTVISVLMEYNHIDRYFKTVFRIAIPLIISLIVELALYYRRRPVKNKTIDELTYRMRTEDYVFDRILYSYLVRYGICILVLAVIFARPYGRLSANAKSDYQVFTFHHRMYAVILEYDDRVLAQEVTNDDDTLSIDITDYRYIDKSGLKLHYKEYDSVVLQAGDVDA